MSSRVRVTTVATALLVTAAALGPVNASAIPPSAVPSSPASTTAGGQQTNRPGTNAPVMVVLDASGSMTTADAPGTRIAAAKRAVTRLVSSVPDDAQVGLEVYGTGTGSANAEKAAGCRDIKILQPVGRIDRSAFVDRVNSIKARGYTPIGESLRRAAAALPKEGPRSIVLVSDGEDTCAPPAPCDVARQLKAQGIDLTVHAIGFKVGGTARSQLQCIARATGGTYTDAGDGGSLGDILSRRVGDAIRGYQTAGIRVTGGDTSGSAPVLQPGQYLDPYAHGAATYSDEGTAKFYRIELAAGDTPYFSATAVAPPVREVNYTSMGIRIEMHSLDASGCSETDTEISSVNASRAPTETAVVAPGATGSKDSCLEPGAVVVKVQRTGSALAGRPIDVELSYRLERPVDSSALRPAAELEPVRRTTVSGAAVPVASGSSFNNAPALTTGVYRDSITPGEARYVKVHLDWGQQLSYSYSAAKQPGYGYGDGGLVKAQLANPLREDVDAPTGANTVASLFGALDTNLFGSSPAPARYRNREATDSNVKRLALAGDYYVVLSSGFASSGRSQRIPYTLRVQVTGTREDGPGDVTGPTRSPSSGTARPSGGPSQASGASGASASPVAGRDERDPGSSTPLLVAGITAGLLLLGGLATGFAARRRRGSHDGGHDGDHTRVLPQQY